MLPLTGAVWMQAAVYTLILILAANATPVLMRLILGPRYAFVIDEYLPAIPGKTLFGRSKSWRGITSALVVTTLVAMALGMPWYLGTLVAAAAMLGDLLSSFIKRRLKIDEGTSTVVLDQAPESLFPCLLVQQTLALDPWQIANVVLVFMILDIVLTLLLRRFTAR
jgi:CDP-2,3-bis-(O-geranylgeranyl)-sn-glycerol synthase